MQPKLHTVCNKRTTLKSCSLFFTYCKLLQNFDKEYQAILNSGDINKYSLSKIYNVYLLRVLNVFKDSGYYLKISRQEMIYIKDSFGVHFQEMKQVANLLLAIQQDFIFLIKITISKCCFKFF